ncbi:hypothetical protein ACLOAU_17920 [Niabella sp. CJ426]|jgi:hypothetical protein|uniref:hypothetical protein n=1 Tax=Niabella sp. CJ426 TaxID=3393740 RepID=UPI003D082699
MSYSIPALIISLILTVTGCQQKSTALSNGDLAISISTVCGWCTGGDSLVINAGKSVYRYSPSCDPAQGTETSISTDKKQWNELVSLLNQQEFKKININLCNVCADGCDVRVTVKDKNDIHSISYGSSSNEAVATVRPFLEKLEAISAAYKKEHKK